MPDPEILRRCPVCGAASRPGAVFCPQCGNATGAVGMLDETAALESPQEQVPLDPRLQTRKLDSSDATLQTRKLDATERLEHKRRTDAEAAMLNPQSAPPLNAESTQGLNQENTQILSSESAPPVPPESAQILTPESAQGLNQESTQILSSESGSTVSSESTQRLPEWAQPQPHTRISDDPATAILPDPPQALEKPRQVSTVVREGVMYDPSFRFVLIAAVLFVLFLVILVLSKVIT